jgi:hypothetical protein
VRCRHTNSARTDDELSAVAYMTHPNRGSDRVASVISPKASGQLMFLADSNGRLPARFIPFGKIKIFLASIFPWCIANRARPGY